jgi:hypothetical protein
VRAVPTPDPTTPEEGRVCPNCKGEFARLVPCEAGEHTEDHPIYGYTKPCPHPFHHPATPNPDREERGETDAHQTLRNISCALEWADAPVEAGGVTLGLAGRVRALYSRERIAANQQRGRAEEAEARAESLQARVRELEEGAREIAEFEHDENDAYSYSFGQVRRMARLLSHQPEDPRPARKNNPAEPV